MGKGREVKGKREGKREGKRRGEEGVTIQALRSASGIAGR